jgi:hypothetical protein
VLQLFFVYTVSRVFSVAAVVCVHFLGYLVLQLFFLYTVSSLVQAILCFNLYFLLYFGFGMLDSEWMVRFGLPRCSNLPEH